MARKTQKKKSQSRRSPRRRGVDVMVFTRHNYMLLVLGVVLIIVGYTAMRIENEMDGFISLYVSPLLILGGYVEVIYAILWRPRKSAAEGGKESQG